MLPTPDRAAASRLAARPAIPRRPSVHPRRPRRAGPGPTCPAAFPTPTTPPARCSPCATSASVDDRARATPPPPASRWLLDLQNRDGGIPTFCRGWGNLPFDRSGADLTAHALHAWAAWRDRLPAGLRRRVDRRHRPAPSRYLASQQRADGAWVPLWFGNQAAADDENPTYGTARVLRGSARRCDDLLEGHGRQGWPPAASADLLAAPERRRRLGRGGAGARPRWRRRARRRLRWRRRRDTAEALGSRERPGLGACGFANGECRFADLVD